MSNLVAGALSLAVLLFVGAPAVVLLINSTRPKLSSREAASVAGAGALLLSIATLQGQFFYLVYWALALPVRWLVGLFLGAAGKLSAFNHQGDWQLGMLPPDASTFTVLAGILLVFTLALWVGHRFRSALASRTTQAH